MKTNTPSGTSKTRNIHEELRNRIIEGRYLPGNRLPTYDEMEQEFDVSRMVLQQAVGRLRDDGFVRSFNRKGLFVADAPPHLCRVALLFADSPGDSAWSRMNTAMVNEARRLEREHPDWQFQVLEGMRNEPEGRGPNLLALEADIRAHRVAGVIFAPKTFELAARPLLADPAVPKTFICAPDGEVPHPIVGVASASLYHRALERLVAKGRRRIAIVHMADTTSKDIDHEALFADFGLQLAVAASVRPPHGTHRLRCHGHPAPRSRVHCRHAPRRNAPGAPEGAATVRMGSRTAWRRTISKEAEPLKWSARYYTAEEEEAAFAATGYSGLAGYTVFTGGQSLTGAARATVMVIR